ncbi:cupredoxin domain-containing protein [Georgenia thermotolerans]|uniref:Plastocyanin n=1 Tax=Georgenia thermotolerans TaxID=527326 RepID=A0A7J5UL39_9MICO|nr:plastocyanin/azurin family copper-binding protein [Georgenia thermotolerans]KAE8763056.1 plastocyanin [Georgenia thermotolerans]
MLSRHPDRRRRAVLAVLASLVLALIVAAPSRADVAAAEHHARTWHVAVGQESRDKAVQGMAFLPGEVWINVGDTVSWRARSAEIHTVTFLPPGQRLPEFNPVDHRQIRRQGGQTHDGRTYLNSGIMSTMPKTGLDAPSVGTYQLRFTRTGDFVYYCLVHGRAMKGTVHVRPAGTAYPHSQAYYDAQARHEAARIIGHGEALWQRTRHAATDDHHVFAGAADDTAMVMRFIRQEVTVRVGEKVTFDMARNAFYVPHTVTFGPEPSSILAPPIGNPAHFRGGQLHSGIIPPGKTFTVTFEKAGTFHYICVLHDGMGMVGTVTVRR